MRNRKIHFEAKKKKKDDPGHSISYKIARAPGEDSDYQSKTLWALGCPQRAWQRLVSEQMCSMIRVYNVVARLKIYFVFETAFMRTASSEKMLSNIPIMCRLTSSCSCAVLSAHPGICSPLNYFIVADDSVCGQRRPWFDWADAQADLGLCCPHMPEDTFCMARTVLSM